MIRSKKLSKFKGIKHAFFNKIDSKSNDIYKRIILPKQTHSNKFYYIDKKVKFIDKKLEVDALITSKKNTPIGFLTADCAPVLIFDKENYMIAAIHAGWKGA